MYELNYDTFVDILYIIKESQKADRTIFDCNYIAIRSYKNEIVGLTISGFKDRQKDKTWRDSFILDHFEDFDIHSLDGYK